MNLNLHVEMTLLLIILLTIPITTDGFFTTEPTNQYAFFGLNVTVHCATNESNHTLSFNAIHADSTTPQPVYTSGNTSAITGTFLLTQGNDGTRVRCRSSSNEQTPPAIMRGQDVPMADNLYSTQADPCTSTIATNWSIALLPGLSVSYTVSVYYLGHKVSVFNVSTTAFTYHPTTGSGVYTVKVKAFSGTLTGEATNTTVDVDTKVVATYDNINTEISGESWIYLLDLTGLCSTPTDITVISCTVDGTCYHTSDVSMENDGTIAANFTGLPDDTMFNTRVLLKYDGDIIQRSNNVTTSTHYLQDVALLNTTANAFCVEYFPVEGTDEYIVDATIKSDNLGAQALQAANIEANTEVCYSDIAASTWTLYGCDGGSTSCDSSNAAVSITDIVVNGSVTTTSTSISPTTMPTTEAMTSAPGRNIAVAAAVIVMSVLALLLFIVIILVIAALAFMPLPTCAR